MKKLVGIVIGIIGISLVGCMPKNNQMKGNSAMKYKFDLENSMLDENISYSFSAEDFSVAFSFFAAETASALTRLRRRSSHLRNPTPAHRPMKSISPIRRDKTKRALIIAFSALKSTPES